MEKNEKQEKVKKNIGGFFFRVSDRVTFFFVCLHNLKLLG